MGWRAWFVNGEYSSNEISPDALPGDGCLVVVHYTGMETPKRFIHSGETWYFWWESPEGLVIGSNSHDLKTNKRRYPGAIFVRGKWTTPALMAEIRKAAQEAREWP